MMQAKTRFRIRRYQGGDADQVAALFYHTIRNVNLAHYTAAEVAAWAPEIDPQKWHEKMSTTFGLIAADGDRVLGFSNLQSDGYLDCLFVHQDAQRRGVGQALMKGIEEEAVSLGLNRLFSDVSHTARPIFEAQGFAVITPQKVEIRGETLENFKMEKHFAAVTSPGR